MSIKDETREINVDSRILLARLKRTTPGEIITYSELSGLVGRDVQRQHRHILDSARKWARKDRVIFGVVTGEGLQRLDDTGKVKAGIGAMARIRRASRRAAQTLTAVEQFDDLPNEMKIEHNMALSVFGIIQQATSSGMQKKIAAKVDGVEGGMLAMKKSLELFA